jgi:hypothetical protein
MVIFATKFYKIGSFLWIILVCFNVETSSSWAGGKSQQISRCLSYFIHTFLSSPNFKSKIQKWPISTCNFRVCFCCLLTCLGHWKCTRLQLTLWCVFKSEAISSSKTHCKNQLLNRTCKGTFSIANTFTFKMIGRVYYVNRVYCLFRLCSRMFY